MTMYFRTDETGKQRYVPAGMAGVGWEASGSYPTTGSLHDTIKTTQPAIKSSRNISCV